MAILTEDMKRVVRDQGLGFYATVSEDGSPNLSPKGTTRVWDEDHLFFADISSPQTVANIRRGSLVEVNVVDPFVRKGYRFKGPAVIYEPGTDGFSDGLKRMREEGSTLVDRVKAIVVIEVRQARPLISPAYDDGTTTETDMLRVFRARFARLHDRLERSATRPSGMVLQPGEGHDLDLRGNLASFKAVAATTSGRFSLMERVVPAGGRTPPPHIHADREEAFYVLSGELEFRLDDARERGASGSFVLVPGGVAHTFANVGASEARVLILHAPAMDGYFEELSALWLGAAPPSAEAEHDLMRRHGMEPA